MPGETDDIERTVGRSIVPMLIGFGCTVSAVMATRTLPSRRDRRMPSPRNVLQLLWQKAKDFLTRAFSSILIATVVVWFLQSFDPHFVLVEESSRSIMAQLAGVLVPVFAPAVRSIINKKKRGGSCCDGSSGCCGDCSSCGAVFCDKRDKGEGKQAD